MSKHLSLYIFCIINIFSLQNISASSNETIKPKRLSTTSCPGCFEIVSQASEYTTVKEKMGLEMGNCYCNKLRSIASRLSMVRAIGEKSKS